MSEQQQEDKKKFSIKYIFHGLFILSAVGNLTAGQIKEAIGALAGGYMLWSMVGLIKPSLGFLPTAIVERKWYLVAFSGTFVMASLSVDREATQGVSSSTNTPALSSNALTQKITSEQFSHTWPYNVPELTLRCSMHSDGKRHYVTGTYAGVEYGVNGTASGSSKYISHDKIWRADPNSPGSRVPHNSVIIEYGLALCTQQNHQAWVSSGQPWHTYKGTLHSEHMDAWLDAPYEDQLITAADIFTSMARPNKPELLDNIPKGDFYDEMEIYAHNMAVCMSNKIKQTFDDSTVLKIGEGCFFKLHLW